MRIRKFNSFPAALVAAFFMLACPAAAQVCNSHAAVVDKLARNYQEARVASGLSSGGKLVEVFATADGATWTIVVTDPRGVSCLVAAGEGWRAAKAQEPGEGS